jgi:hypothetical protein
MAKKFIPFNLTFEVFWRGFEMSIIDHKNIVPLMAAEA